MFGENMINEDMCKLLRAEGAKEVEMPREGGRSLDKASAWLCLPSLYMIDMLGW
jgi:hypothetical protein